MTILAQIREMNRSQSWLRHPPVDDDQALEFRPQGAEIPQGCSGLIPDVRRVGLVGGAWDFPPGGKRCWFRAPASFTPRRMPGFRQSPCPTSTSMLRTAAAQRLGEPCSGFAAKMAVHPRPVLLINNAYTPTADEMIRPKRSSISGRMSATASSLLTGVQSGASYLDHGMDSRACSTGAEVDWACRGGISRL